MATKLVEHTYGSHIFMRMMLDDKSIEEIGVYYDRDGHVSYRTTADSNDELTTEEKQKKRAAIITAFNELY